VIRRYGWTAGLAVALGIAVAHAQERPRAEFQVSRVPAADGAGARPADLRRIEAAYDRVKADAQKKIGSMVVRAKAMKEEGHHAGLPSCRARGERSQTLAERVPERFRPLTLYFVRIPKAGGRPRILPETVPASAEVFVLDTASLDDVATLSRLLAKQVSLATKEFAAALGVRCGDSMVTFTPDGLAARVTEVSP
jgi:hypothetical protein